MVKDENVCLHCGLCAERCPTYAWDMRKFVLQIPYAGATVIPLHGGVSISCSCSRACRAIAGIHELKAGSWTREAGSYSL